MVRALSSIPWEGTCVWISCLGICKGSDRPSLQIQRGPRCLGCRRCAQPLKNNELHARGVLLAIAGPTRESGSPDSAAMHRHRRQDNFSQSRSCRLRHTEKQPHTSAAIRTRFLTTSPLVVRRQQEVTRLPRPHGSVYRIVTDIALPSYVGSFERKSVPLGPNIVPRSSRTAWKGIVCYRPLIARPKAGKQLLNGVSSKPASSPPFPIPVGEEPHSRTRVLLEQ